MKKVFSRVSGKWLLKASLCMLLIFAIFKNYVNINKRIDIDSSEFKKKEKPVDINIQNTLISDKLKLISDGFVDKKRKSRVPWKSDKECNRFNITFGKNLPLVYLVSYPRSGNTWVRYLIESTTGIFTGSNYNSLKGKSMGFLGELENPQDGTTIIIKAHGYGLSREIGRTELFQNKEIPIVLLIRNPQRSIWSYWNYLKTHRSFFKSVRVPWETDEYEDFVRFINTKSKSWDQLYSTYLSIGKTILPIFYENVVKNPAAEVEKIVKFLGFKTDPQRLECVRKYSEGPAKRNHSEEWHIDEKTHRPLSRAMRNVLKLLHEKGFNPPTEYEKFAEDFHEQI